MSQKNNSKNTLIILAVTAFVTRIISLLKIPMFTDEAIYIRWAQIGLADRSQWFISLTDGKQPLVTWLMYPFLLVIKDPLFAGRIVSVLAGTISTVLVYLIGKKLFGHKVGIYSSILYIFSPFAMVYDRLALMDSLLGSCVLGSLYFQIIFCEKQTLKNAGIVGLISGLGLITKSSAVFSLYLLPAQLLLLIPHFKKDFSKYIKWITFIFISFVIGQLIYNSLRISPWFYIIKLKNYSFILTLKEFLHVPFQIFEPNLNGLWGWFTVYLTWPVLALVFIALGSALLRKNIKILYLFLWFIFPFLALTAFGKVLFPRFIFFMTMPLFVVAGFGLNTVTQLKNKVLISLIVLVFLAYPVYQTGILIFDPVHAAIPTTDRNQLFDDWPSGYGVKEVVSYLDIKSKKGKVVVGTEGTFGLFPASIEIYLKNNPNMEIYGFWPVNEVPLLLLEKAKLYPTYLVFKDKQIIPPEWPLELVFKIRRGIGNTYLLFYQVKI